MNYSYVIGKDSEISTPDHAIWKHNPREFNRRDVIAPLSELKDFLQQLDVNNS